MCGLNKLDGNKISLHGREVGRQFLGLFAFFLPASCHCLPLSVKLDSALSVEVSSTPHRVLVSGKGEHWEWNGDGQIYANLPGLNLSLEFAGSVAISCEDGAAVAPAVAIYKVNSIL